MTPSPPPSPETRGDALERLLALSPASMTLGLRNIRALLERLGHPERGLRTCVVAGTNGKGSGRRTGRFLSPHIHRVAERIAVDGRPVDLETLEAAAARVMAQRGAVDFSCFEGITAAALLVFAGRGVDVAVLEVGLGGRFDATNVTEPGVCVVTSIALDHRRLLGDTPEEILREKLGVVRPGVPLVCGWLGPELEAIVHERARRDGFPVACGDALGCVEILDVDFEGTRVRLSTPVADYPPVRIPFVGDHQARNALLAVAAFERFAGMRAPVEGLERARLAGRFESRRLGDARLVLDVAHNDAALGALARTVSRLVPSREDVALVLGMMRRKELDAACDALVGAVRRIAFFAPPGEDAHDPAALAAAMFGRGPVRGVDAMLWRRNDDAGLRTLVERLAERHRVVVATGSHHVVAAVDRALAAPGRSGADRRAA